MGMILYFVMVCRFYVGYRLEDSEEELVRCKDGTGDRRDPLIYSLKVFGNVKKLMTLVLCLQICTTYPFVYMGL